MRPWAVMAVLGLLLAACGGGGGTPSHEDDPLGTLSWQSITVTADQIGIQPHAASSAASLDRLPPPGPTPLHMPATIAPDDVAMTLIPQVRGARPLLLPAGIGWRWAIDATIQDCTDSSFRVTYGRSAEPPASLSLSIEQAGPPAAPPLSSQELAFRRDPAALYRVINPVDPDSARQLTWKEPGRWAPAGLPEQTWVPYSLAATGLTDDEFWDIADSLRNVQD